MLSQLEELKKEAKSLPRNARGKRKFSAEFREKVVHCYHQKIGNVSHIAGVLEMSPSLLSLWIKKDKRSKNGSNSSSPSRFKQIKVTQGLSERSLEERSLSAEIHLPNRVVIRNVDWGFVERLVYGGGL